MKKILKDQSGVALITVLGIMLVISILATGLFYFSFNELNFSVIEYDNIEATYLARAGIEIASKSFDNVAGQFDLSKEVTANLYLHHDASGNAIINSEEANNEGEIVVTIKEGTRNIDYAGEKNDYPVMTYSAKAMVNGATGKASGITLLSAHGNAQPASDEGEPDHNYLYWVPKNGVIEANIIDADYNKVYSEDTPAVAAGPMERMRATIRDIFGIAGSDKIGQLPVYFTYYPGVVTIASDSLEGGDAIRVDDSYNKSQKNCNRAFALAAPAIVVDVPIDMRKDPNNVRSTYTSVNMLSFVSNTVVFNKEITLYANDFSYQIGDIVLSPLTPNGTGVVYFNAPVYLINGNKKLTLFPAGSVLEYGAADTAKGKQQGDPVQLFVYACETGAIDYSKGNDGFFSQFISAIGGWLLGFKDLTTGSFEAIDAPIENPNANSLTEITWE